ncbi:MAG: TIM barrel protein [Planctomycetota bacterium]
MLLTCNASSIADLLQSKGRQQPKLRLGDVPAYVKDELGLHGLNLSTDLLVGSTPERLTELRDRADKSGCAILLLIEAEPQAFGDPDDEVGFAAIDRMRRVLHAASLLGCNSAAMKIQSAEDEDSQDRVVDRVREVVKQADKLDINLLISPHEGLTAEPESLTELIKKIGGFRIGTLPDFKQAHDSGDPETYLRRLTPYASVVLAATFEFEIDDSALDDGPGSLEALADALMSSAPPKHVEYDLAPMLDAINSVGFDGTLAVDFRGGEDGTLGVLQSKEALEAAIESLGK